MNRGQLVVDWSTTRLVGDEPVIADFALLSMLLNVGLHAFTCSPSHA